MSPTEVVTYHPCALGLPEILTIAPVRYRIEAQGAWDAERAKAGWEARECGPVFSMAWEKKLHAKVKANGKSARTGMRKAEEKQCRMHPAMHVALDVVSGHFVAHDICSKSGAFEGSLLSGTAPPSLIYIGSSRKASWQYCAPTLPYQITGYVPRKLPRRVPCLQHG